MSLYQRKGGHIGFNGTCQFVSNIFLESVGGILPTFHGYIVGTSQRDG